MVVLGSCRRDFDHPDFDHRAVDKYESFGHKFNDHYAPSRLGHHDLYRSRDLHVSPANDHIASADDHDPPADNFASYNLYIGAAYIGSNRCASRCFLRSTGSNRCDVRWYPNDLWRRLRWSKSLD
jgi:hypothetical protein